MYGVFIDDSGSPGLKETPAHLHPERKTWVAIIVPPHQMPEVLEQFPGAIGELQRLLGAAEFHFAHVHAGKGAFHGVELYKRLALFKFMAEIFQTYKFPILVQTFDPHTLAEMISRGGLPQRLGAFNLRRHADLALLFLLIRVKWYVERERMSSTMARVFVDEGYKKHGVALPVPVPAWRDVIADGLVCFARSSSIYPVQLADFAAFSLNRWQLLVGKEVLSPLDQELLKILSPIAWNYVNIEKRVFRLDGLEDESHSKGNSSLLPTRKTKTYKGP